MADEGRATAGQPSKNEKLKEASDSLRGSLADELANAAPNVTGSAANLLKFHGTYQQDDRDQRAAARRTGEGGRAHSFMVRTKLPAGALPGPAYLAFDRLAGEYANGTLRITTRQDIQFHGVLKRNLAGTLRAINAALVTTLGACGDVVRNTTACPAPYGEAVRLGFDALAHAISDHFLPRTHAYAEIFLDGEPFTDGDAPSAGGSAPEEPFYGATYLPRKFKIGLGLPHDNCIDVHTNDLALLAVLDERGELEGWDLFAGGGLGMSFGVRTTYPRLATPFGFIPAGEEIELCEAVVAVQRDHGNRSDRKQARLKYLLDDWGTARFREAVAAQLGRPLAASRGVPVDAITDHLGWGDLADGRLALGLYVANGRIQDTDTVLVRTALREAVTRFGLDVRMTAQQNVLLIGVAPEDRDALTALLDVYGVSTQPPLAMRRAAMACPALPTCGLAVADAERVLPAIVDALEDVLIDLHLDAEPLSVRMTGCPNGCARPWVSDIGFVGRSLGLYNVYVGGNPEGTRMNSLVAELIHEDRLVETLRPALTAYARARAPGESFGDYCLRRGPAQIARLIEDAQSVATR